MAWTFTSELGEFPDAAEAWLRRDPVRNTVPLTVLARLRQGLWADGFLLGWLTGGGEVCGVVIHTPPHPLVLGDIPHESVAPLARELRDRDFPAVHGPLAQADAFASAGGLETARLSQRLYRLGTLWPPSCAVSSRFATDDDTALIVEWTHAFIEETEGRPSPDDPLPQVRNRIGLGEIVVGEAGGRPVSLAGSSSPITGMSRIGPVYTPVESRGRGFGSAVTHAATRAAQEAGADLLLLFTDLANPTSNSIYQALGYEPVADYASISLTRWR